MVKVWSRRGHAIKRHSGMTFGCCGGSSPTNSRSDVRSFLAVASLLDLFDCIIIVTPCEKM
jgi:hypothetical protein